MPTFQDAIAELDEKKTISEIKRRIRRGDLPDKILEEIQMGLRIVGERFKSKRYALIEIGMADELYKECLSTIESLTGKNYSQQQSNKTKNTQRVKSRQITRVD
ncbi:MAG TPA: B12-binding domain-containing protein [Nitrososphaerales archaeon]